MTLTRLLDDPEDDFESALLRSAQLDLPDEARVLRGVAGITAAAAAITASGPAVAATGASAAAAAQAGSGSAGIGPALVLKWLGVGAVAGTLVTGMGAYVTTSMDEVAKGASDRGLLEAAPPRAGVAGKPRPGLPGPVAEPRVLDDAPLAPEVMAPLDGRPSPSRRRPAPELAPRPDDPTAGPPSGAGAGGVPLAAEVETLSRARMALARREPVRALSELRQYEVTRKTRVLDEEALVLRLESLLQLRHVGQVRELAERHLAAHPGCAHQARLRQIVAGSFP